MFTGLVQALGTVDALAATPDGVRLRIATELASDVSEGDSVAVCGVCLTARSVEPDGFSADVMRESVERTSLGRLERGSAVNIELALRATDRLGGHVVQGHVDGVGTVAAVRPEGFARRLSVDAPRELLRYVVEKGSITVDGVSLTVATLTDGGFEVGLIPETLERTTLGTARPGRRVNLEVDVLAKYVERLLDRGTRGAATQHEEV